MNKEIRNLEPRALWNHFADLNAVPRGSKKEEQVIEFMKDFGKSLNLETIEDEVGNVIIRKPATKGMENRKMIVMQSHLDMVHQKNNDTDFDFDTQGIEMVVDGDWVRAKGTTLGADNGLGVATIMAVLKSDDIAHPAIEALFTIDEETGMTGALGLKEDVLQGKILLNLDTEEDDELSVGCAGGVDITAEKQYKEVPVSEGAVFYTVEVKGLQGGHSGMDIHKGLGNANKLMNRILVAVKDFTEIHSIEGGSLRNAIPRESVAKIAVTSEADFKTAFDYITAELKNEYRLIEPNLVIKTGKTEESFSKVMKTEDRDEFLKVVSASFNGVFRMSPTFDDLVETSNNVAKVTVGSGQVKIECLTRSAVESSKADLANVLTSGFELGGYAVTHSGSYPGWEPDLDSPILKVLKDLYVEINGEEPNVAAGHGGLECGILKGHYPDMDMISFGPTIRGAHSPDERASISSAQKYWNYVLEILKNIPEK